MTARNEMLIDIKSLLTDTMMLSATEKWAYLALLMQMHLSNDGWIEDDEASLMRLTGVPIQHWQRVRRALDSFLVRRGGKISQKRILRDRESRCVTSTPAHIDNKPTSLRLSLDSENRLESERESRLQKKQTRTTLKETWCIGVEELAYAKQHGFSQGQAQSMGQAFRDHHRSKGNRMADWSAAWRMWVRNEVKFNSRYRGNGNGNGRGKTSLVEAWDKLSRAVESAEDSESGQGPLLGLSDRSIR